MARLTGATQVDLLVVDRLSELPKWRLRSYYVTIRGKEYAPKGPLSLTDHTLRNGPVVCLREMPKKQVRSIERKLGAKVDKRGPPPDGKILQREGKNWVVVDYKYICKLRDEPAFVEMNRRKNARIKQFGKQWKTHVSYMARK